MAKRVRGRFCAGLIVFLLAASSIPLPAAAYPATLTTFVGGAADAQVTLGFPPLRQLVGTLAVPSNATVTSATVDIEPAAGPVTVDATHDGNSGFPDGAADPLVARGPFGLSPAEVNGSTEFSGPDFDLGSFVGTAVVGGSVVLSAPSGSYRSPPIAWNQVSYGRLIANITVPPGAGASISIVSPSGTLLQDAVRPGDLIDVAASAPPAIHISVAMTKSPAAASPAVSLLGAGFAVADYTPYGPTAAARLVSGLSSFNGPLELRQNLSAYSLYSANPLVGPTAGTWYTLGFDVSSAVTVGDEIWLYGSGRNTSNVEVIGRFVSADGGYTFAADANPLLVPSTDPWEDSGLFFPYVIHEEGTFKMWFGGSSSGDSFSIGYATSPDGLNWTKFASNPVFTPATPTAWDERNVGWPKVVHVADTYWMYYSGRTNTNARKAIGLATSSDGISWTRDPGNPRIEIGSVAYANYEAAASDARYVDGVFHLYWTCADSSNNYNACLSYSTDGRNFTHSPANPVITNGHGTWDQVTAQAPVWATDPASGLGVVFYSTMSDTTYRYLARADPQREAQGTYSATWNLSGERPARFTAARVNAELPAQTSLTSSMAVSPDNLNYGAPENFSLSTTSLTTSPSDFARIAVDLSTTDLNESPRFHGARVDYSRYAPGGTFTSAPLPCPFLIRDATVTLTESSPAGTQILLELSADNGTTWQAAISGTPSSFAAPGSVFRYRITLAGTSGDAPQVSQVQIHLNLAARPSDVRLETAAGALLASVSGELSTRVTLALHTPTLNALVAPWAGSQPPLTAPVDLFANSTTPGLLRVSNLSVQLSFPDALRCFFGPAGDALEIAENSSQVFRVQASTSAGVAIHYSWWADGVPAGADSSEFTFVAPYGSAGTHAVRAMATNGQFTQEHQWNVTVTARPPPVVTFFPDAGNLSVITGMTQSFLALINLGDPPASIRWTLDSLAPTAGSTFSFVAPVRPGPHTLQVEVSQGSFAVSRGWDISVIDPPALPAGQLLVIFAPNSDVVVPLNTTVAFSATLEEDVALPITYRWRTTEGLVGLADEGVFTVNGTTPGSYAVWVAVQNETRLSTHIWYVTVLPEGGTAPSQSGTVGPETNASLDAAPWVIAAVSLAVAVVLGTMLLRSRGRKREP